MSFFFDFALYSEQDEEYFQTPAFSQVPPPNMKSSGLKPMVFTNPETGTYSSTAQKLMGKMGFVQGGGLGKQGQGNSQFVQAEQKLTRRGLGFGKTDNGFESQTHEVDETKTVPIQQDINWLVKGTVTEQEESKSDFDFSAIKYGNPIMVDYSKYSEKSHVDKLFSYKSKFDNLDRRDFMDARNRANPYETVGKGIFLNRAAMKMANLDKMFNILPKPGQTDDIFYFADICAGPGGFTEYLLWRASTEKLNVTGFGFTLKGAEDFNLYKFHPEAKKLINCFETTYGKDGSGNIYSTENMKHFRDHVMQVTNQKGLDFIMGDGGASTEGEENIQEIKLKQLLLCQFTAMMSVLKKGGNLLCKVFDLFTPFSVGVLYILSKKFKHFCIIKPYTSRPANSERYVVCLDYLSDQNDSVIEYLYSVNDKLNEAKSDEDSVTDIVAETLIQSDPNFVNYVKDSNNDLAQKQCDSIDDLFKCIEDKFFNPYDQSSTRKSCMWEWNVPIDPPKKSNEGAKIEMNYEDYSTAHKPNLYKFDNKPKEWFGDNSVLIKTKEEQRIESMNKHTNSVYSSIGSKWQKKKPVPKIPQPKKQILPQSNPINTKKQITGYIRSNNNNTTNINQQTEENSNKRKFITDSNEPNKKQNTGYIRSNNNTTNINQNTSLKRERDPQPQQQQSNKIQIIETENKEIVRKKLPAVSSRKKKRNNEGPNLSDPSVLAAIKARSVAASQQDNKTTSLLFAEVVCC